VSTTEVKRSRYLAEYSKSVVRQQTVRLIHEEVSADELLEAPVLALHEPVSTLTLCAFIIIDRI